MRGRDDRSGGLFSYVRLEERVPADHPLRPIRALADKALAALNGRFEALYSSMGRPSIPPEMLLRATLLQAFFSVRSERMLMEQINYNLLFRWFVGLPLDGAVWHATVFTHNRDRLLEAEVAREFLSALLSLPRVKTLLSDEHFSVDGTLIDAWASMKSFRPKDGSGSPPGPGRNGERDFRKEKRSNESHASTTDPDARLYRKADRRESRLWLHGARPDGEPQRPCGRCRAYARHRDGGTGSGAFHARPPPVGRARQARGRQGLRRERLRPGPARAHGDAAHCRQWRGQQTRGGPQDGGRRPHDAACRLRRQPKGPQAHRGGLRLDQGLAQAST